MVLHNIRTNYLRVKIVNLGDEARYIRKKEIQAARKLHDMGVRRKLTFMFMIDKFPEKQLQRLKDAALRINSETRRRKQGFDPHALLYADARMQSPSTFVQSNLLETEPQWSSIINQHKLKMELKEHRKTVVRREARAALLAYGFLRGKPLRNVEKQAKFHNINPYSATNKKLWTRVEQIVSYFSSENPRLLAQRFAAWKDEAWRSFPEAVVDQNEPSLMLAVELVEGGYEKDWNNA
jgi:hypothetical protein